MAGQKDISVPGAERRDLLVDLYPPQGESLHTAVILLHGGAWRTGSRKMMAPYARVLAAHGFFAVAPEYRLLGESPWPAQLDDVKSVIRWLRSRAADFDVHPDKIAVEGFSAGGHLALLAAGTEYETARIGAVVSFFAPDILEVAAPPPGILSPAQMLLGPNADPATVAAASPLSHFGRGFPPTFLLGGMADPLVPRSITLGFFDALIRAGGDVDLHFYHGHTHEFAALPSMLEPVQAEVALFLKRALVDPERYRRENRELNIFAQPGGPLGPPPFTP